MTGKPRVCKTDGCRNVLANPHVRDSGLCRPCSDARRRAHINHGTRRGWEKGCRCDVCHEAVGVMCKTPVLGPRPSSCGVEAHAEPGAGSSAHASTLVGASTPTTEESA